MKAKLSILLLFVMAVVSSVSAQRVRPAGYESVYFDREDYVHQVGDTVVYLLEKGGRFAPERKDPGEMLGFKKMAEDLLPLFKREFPDLNYPEDLQKFRGIRLSLWVDHEGNVVNYYYRFSSDHLALYPDMEKHLYRFAQSVKESGVKKYDVHALYPGSYCVMNYMFSYMYRDLVMGKL